MSELNFNMNKLISIALVTILLTTQIGCAGKTERVSSPLKNLQVDDKKDYTLFLKKGDWEKFSGSKLKVEQDQLLVQTEAEEMKIADEDIRCIEWVGKKEGTNALKGMTIGAIALGVPSLVLFTAVADGFSDWSRAEGGKGASTGRIIGIGLTAGAMGAAIGGVIGLGIGALIPKYSYIQFTPVIEPTQSGVNAGANVGFKF